MNTIKKIIATLWNSDGTPTGVRVLTAVTSIRWIGWGFAESLMPVFLYSFGDSFAQAGMLQSVYTASLVLTLPILGFAADRIRATTLVMIGLILYLFVGTSFLIAGITGMVLFVIIARIINGVAFGMDSIGRETYFRRNIPHNKVATMFGYQDSVTNFWWITASLFGIVLIGYFTIPQLLFMIAPTALVALLILLRFRRKDDSEMMKANTTQLSKVITLVSRTERSDWALFTVAVTYFFISIASSIILFFVPIQAYTEGAELSQVIIMGIIIALPTLFGLGLGKLFNKKGHQVFPVGVGILALLIGILAFLKLYIWQLFLLFLIAIVLELLLVGYQELVTVHARPEHYGRTGGILRGITTFGTLIGPFIAGLIIDRSSISLVYGGLSILLCVIAVLFWFIQTRSQKEVVQAIEKL